MTAQFDLFDGLVLNQNVRQLKMDVQRNGDRLSALMAEAVDEIVEKERDKLACEAETWREQASIYCTSEIERLFFVGYLAYKEILARHWCSTYRLDIVPPVNRRAEVERLTRREPLAIPFHEVVRDPSYLASQFKRFLDSTDGQLAELDFLWPQVSIGPYRADFAICRAKMDWVDKKCSEVPYIDAVAISVPVVIECDGHDFHDRTKEQAEHDRQRDRYMQANNFRVMRFTGRELYRDPMECATEVDDFLSSEKSVAKQQYLCLL